MHYDIICPIEKRKHGERRRSRLRSGRGVIIIINDYYFTRTSIYYATDVICVYSIDLRTNISYIIYYCNGGYSKKNCARLTHRRDLLQNRVCVVLIYIICLVMRTDGYHYDRPSLIHHRVSSISSVDDRSEIR